MKRLAVQDLQGAVTDSFAQDVRLGLRARPKALPPKYFYDTHGSELFEAICGLPEYYPTRTETLILGHMASELFALTGPCELVELGSGSSTKTRVLLDALTLLDPTALYRPVDVSHSMLKNSALALSEEYPKLVIRAIVADYEHIWSQLPLAEKASRMLIFLGSTLGNFSAAECDLFLTKISTALQPGEYFLLGVDLQKDQAIVEAAYNDSQGVTAAFNRNVLHRINYTFNGNFDLDQFIHRAFYNPLLHQIEMHLVSQRVQTVELADLEMSINFDDQETIHTESSRKFDPQITAQMLTAQGLDPIHQWQDPQGWFMVILAQKR